MLLDARATAAIEFTLVFPLLLFLSLTLAQATYLMGDNVILHYASFAAARSAIVQVPLDLPDVGEPRNGVLNGPGHAKHEAVRAAAVAALAPASGVLESGDAAGDPYAAGLAHHYDAFGMTPPAWVASAAAARYRYSNANTLVDICSWVEDPLPPATSGRLIPLPNDTLVTFGPRDPVGVIVTHRISLSVPYVNWLFSNGRHTPATGKGFYTSVSASSLLTNEGVADALPPLPPLPRDP